MPRYFLRLSFKGTAYAGWQIQDNAVTVQGELNRALSVLLRSEIMVTGCGRTDTGVHASMFYAHFDFPEQIDQDGKFLISINALLPDDIAIVDCITVDDSAHARFSATSRTYEYFISGKPDPFYRDYSLLSYHLPDMERMNKACSYILGHHNFSSFCKTKSGNNTFDCNVTHAHWSERQGLLVFNISANRFLRGMVRTLVGTMINIGQGKSSPESIAAILSARDRTLAGKSALALGLFLTRVEYPFIPTPEPVKFPV